VYLIIPIGIIVLVKVVGIILTIALLTIPVSIAKMRFRSIGKVIVSAMIISFLFCLTGITLAYYLNIPSGVSIIIVSATVYFLMAILRDRVRKWKHRRMKHIRSSI
jgi:zinc transport system permease protein